VHGTEQDRTGSGEKTGSRVWYGIQDSFNWKKCLGIVVKNG
jgi:hypothetical protein